MSFVSKPVWDAGAAKQEPSFEQGSETEGNEGFQVEEL